MKKSNYRKLTIIYMSYIVVTSGCLCLSWLFPEYRCLLFQMWYSMTVITWLASIITLITFLIRMIKIKQKT